MDFSHQFYQDEHDVDLSQFPSTNLITDSLFVDLFCPPMMKDLEPVEAPQRLPSDDQHVIMIPAPSPPPLIVKEERAETDEKQQKEDILDPKIIERVVKVEPVDLNTLLTKASKRGRKRKTSAEAAAVDELVEHESDEYRRKRLRNNIAVRKSRERAKMRHEDTQHKLLELAKENQNQRQVIATIQRDFGELEKRTNATQKRFEDLRKMNVRLRQFISNLPPEYQPKFTF